MRGSVEETSGPGRAASLTRAVAPVSFDRYRILAALNEYLNKKKLLRMEQNESGTSLLRKRLPGSSSPARSTRRRCLASTSPREATVYWC